MVQNVITQATKGQIKQNDRFLEDFFSKLKSEIKVRFSGLSIENAQKFLGNGDEFGMDVRNSAVNSFVKLSVSNKYSNKIVSSNCTYPEEFVRKPEEEQIAILCEKFLGIDPAQTIAHLKQFMTPLDLPMGCHPQDGKYAILSPFGAQLIVPGYSDPFSAELYCKTLLKLFDIIKSERNFCNYREGQIDEQHLRQSLRTLELYKYLANTQGQSPIWLVDAQLGFLHKGESVNKAREIFMPNEFGLGSIAMASITESHPDRYVHFEELDTDCAGDEFAPGAIGVFSKAPFFSWHGGGLKFGTSDVSGAYVNYGSASAFVPQN